MSSGNNVNLNSPNANLIQQDALLEKPSRRGDHIFVALLAILGTLAIVLSTIYGGGSFKSMKDQIMVGVYSEIALVVVTAVAWKILKFKYDTKCREIENKNAKIVKQQAEKARFAAINLAEKARFAAINLTVKEWLGRIKKLENELQVQLVVKKLKPNLNFTFQNSNGDIEDSGYLTELKLRCYILLILKQSLVNQNDRMELDIQDNGTKYTFEVGSHLLNDQSKVVRGIDAQSKDKTIKKDGLFELCIQSNPARL